MLLNRKIKQLVFAGIISSMIVGMEDKENFRSRKPKCRICLESFQSYTKKIEHEEELHEIIKFSLQDKNEDVDIKKRKITENSEQTNISVHQEVQEPSTKHQKIMLSNEILKNNILASHEKEYYECPFCEKTFSCVFDGKSIFKAHINGHQTKLLKGCNPKYKYTMFCNLCDKIVGFKNTENYIKHIEKQHMNKK